MYATAGTKKRKRKVTLCLKCQEQGRRTMADFVHLTMYPCTDLGVKKTISSPVLTHNLASSLSLNG